jgi:hypothetical protein
LDYGTEDLHVVQEELRDTREALLGVRIRLRTKRHENREIRQRAEATIGNAFNLVRKYLLKQNSLLPSHISEALRNVDEVRDKLGNTEADYDDAEEQYNRQEWSYTQLEENLIDLLPDERASPRPPQRHIIQAADTEFLTVFTDATEDILNYPNLEELVQLSLNERQTPGMQRIRSPIPPVPLKRPLDHITPCDARSHKDLSRTEMPTTPSRSFSEADLVIRLSQWSTIRYRIDEWLLESLRSSTLERKRLRDALAQHDLADTAWFQTVVRFWYSNGPPASYFHTGDTTVSGSIDGPRTFGPPNLGQTYLTLLETELQQELLSEGGDDATRFPLPESDSNTSDADQTTILPETPTERHPRISSGVVSPVDISPDMQNLHQGICPSTSISDLDSGGKTTNTEISQYDDLCRKLVASIVEPVAVDSTQIGSTQSVSSQGGDRSIPTTPRLLRSNQQPQSRTQHLSQLFIKVSGPSPWLLPLLRLTPSPHSVRQLECIPFVSTFDTPFCLPGPPTF